MAKMIIVNAKRCKGDYEGRKFEFTKLQVLNRRPVVGDANKLGLEILEMRGDYNLFDRLSVLPGEYEVDYDLVPNGKVASLQVYDLSFVREISFLTDISKNKAS